MSPHPKRSETLHIRLSPAAKAALSAAAKASRRSTCEFVLESALARADETLAERRYFGIDAERWAAFHAALDAPPHQLPRLQRLLSEPSTFDAESIQ